MDNSRKKILVHLIKTFSYPRASLDKNYPHDDARAKALTHLVSEMNELQRNEFRGIDENFFEVEINEESPFELRETIKQMYKEKRGAYREVVYLKQTILLITEFLMIKKYGKDIYLEEGKNKKVKPEIDEDFNNTYMELFDLMHRQKMK